MRTFLLLSLITVGLSFGLSQIASAVCVQTGTIPGQGNIINCPAPIQNSPLDDTSVPATTNLADEVNIPEGGGLNVGAGRAVDTDDGDDVVTTSGDITGGSNAIFTGDNDDTIIVNGGTLIGSSSQAIWSDLGADIITINGGFVEGDTQAIFSDGGDDMITVNAGTLVGKGSQAMFTSGGNDTVIINGGVLDASNTNTQIIFTGGENDTVILNGGTYLKGGDEVILLGSQNDILTFGGDIDLDGSVNCGSDFDTLVFAMEVPEEAVGFFSTKINSADPSGDSVVINDITYEWEFCELLVADLNGVRVVRPIPTLSQWGLIAMAGVLGIVGLLAVRRKTISA